MDLALFPWVAFACLFALMPSEFWNFFSRVFSKTTLPARTLAKNSSLTKKMQILMTPIFLIALAWNIASYTKDPLPTPVRNIAQWLHIDQYWGMFAPYPLKDSGWYEFGVELWSGEYLYAFVDDTMEEQWDEDKERPKAGYKYYVDQRWRKYLINLWNKKNAKFRPALASYLCRKWNEEYEAPSEKAVKIDLEFTLYQNKEYLMPARGPANIYLGSYKCK
ncbi:MAG: hypothetical protein R3A80_04790 [Bdellovibrionota bacterium]